MAEFTKATSTDDVLKDYNEGMNFYAIAQKYGVPMETVRDVVEEAIPDADGFETIQPEQAAKV